MPTTHRSRSARAAGLTRDQVVDAAIDILDTEGERGLTFRTLALHLQTGHGAIQWHVTNKSELLIAATVSALAQALPAGTQGTTPRDAVHAVALGVFDAIDAHPWLGSQLYAAPSQPAMVNLWETLGRSIEAMGVEEGRLFTAVSTLLSYIVGVASQNAVNARLPAADANRGDFLGAIADHWASQDPVEHRFVRRVADQLRDHDDRREFLAGIDIIITGLTATR